MTDTRGITRSRRRFAVALGTGVAGAVAGCLGTDPSATTSIDDGSDAAPDGGDEAPAVSADASAAIGMVYALGGLDDRSFNDAANRGIQRARLDHDVAFTNEEPGSMADFRTTQATLSASEQPDYDLICCIGFL